MNSNGSLKRVIYGLAGVATLSVAVVMMVRGFSKPGPATVDPAADPQPTVEAVKPAARPASLPPPPAPAPAVQAPTLQHQWGIFISSVGLTQSNTTVELRYQVLAPDKTTLLANAGAEAYLIDEASGTKLEVLAPRAAPGSPNPVRSRTMARMMREAGEFPPSASKLVAGMVYSLRLPNWGGTLKTGSQVAVVVGNARQDGLTVEALP
jgi:hypothetical protein